LPSPAWIEIRSFWRQKIIQHSETRYLLSSKQVFLKPSVQSAARLSRQTFQRSKTVTKNIKISENATPSERTLAGFKFVPANKPQEAG
jgi:hypothetical protein